MGRFASGSEGKYAQFFVTLSLGSAFMFLLPSPVDCGSCSCDCHHDYTSYLLPEESFGTDRSIIQPWNSLGPDLHVNEIDKPLVDAQVGVDIGTYR